MNRNICPLCRASMRQWALCARTPKTPVTRLCINTAISFREECLHTDRDKYDALVAKLNKLPLKTSRLSIALWSEIERIKNLHNGHKPAGRTFRAWVLKFEPNSTGDALQPSTLSEAA